MGSVTSRVAVALSILALGFGVDRVRGIAFTHRQDAEQYSDVYYLPPPDWLPVMSFGYRAAAGDLLWCRTLIYFGDSFLRRAPAKYVFAYADAMIALDPDFKAPYRWAAVGSLYLGGGDFDLKDALHAVDYLRTAVKRWPTDGDLAWELGSNLRFEIAPHLDQDSPVRRKLELEAADALSTAAVLGAGPPWLALNSSALLEKLGKKDQAVRHLQEVYATVQDPDVKRKIGEQLAALRSETYREAMQEATEQEEQARRASFPYVSPTLFPVLGEKSAAARMELLRRNFLPPDVTTQLE